MRFAGLVPCSSRPRSSGPALAGPRRRCRAGADAEEHHRGDRRAHRSGVGHLDRARAGPPTPRSRSGTSSPSGSPLPGAGQDPSRPQRLPDRVRAAEHPGGRRALHRRQRADHPAQPDRRGQRRLRRAVQELQQPALSTNLAGQPACTASKRTLPSGSIAQLYADTGVFFTNDARMARNPLGQFLDLSTAGINMAANPPSSATIVGPLIGNTSGSLLSRTTRGTAIQVRALGGGSSVAGNMGKGVLPFGYGSPVAGPLAFDQCEATEPVAGTILFNDARGPVDPHRLSGLARRQRRGQPGGLEGDPHRRDHRRRLRRHAARRPSAPSAIRFAGGEMRTGQPVQAEVFLKVTGVPLDPSFTGLDQQGRGLRRGLRRRHLGPQPARLEHRRDRWPVVVHVSLARLCVPQPPLRSSVNKTLATSADTLSTRSTGATCPPTRRPSASATLKYETALTLVPRWDLRRIHRRRSPAARASTASRGALGTLPPLSVRLQRVRPASPSPAATARTTSPPSPPTPRPSCRAGTPPRSQAMVTGDLRAGGHALQQLEPVGRWHRGPDRCDHERGLGRRQLRQLHPGPAGGLGHRRRQRHHHHRRQRRELQQRLQHQPPAATTSRAARWRRAPRSRSPASASRSPAARPRGCTINHADHGLRRPATAAPRRPTSPGW